MSHIIGSGSSGLGINRAQTITDGLNEEEWRKTRLLDARGAEQELSVISESGLYGAISQSNNPRQKISSDG